MVWDCLGIPREELEKGRLDYLAYPAATVTQTQIDGGIDVKTEMLKNCLDY